MSASKGKIAVIGGGVIGRSWTATFLAGGYEVVIADPAEGIEDQVMAALPDYLHGIPNTSFDEKEVEAMLSRVSFEKDAKKAVVGVVAVQENGPENEDIKADLFADIEGVVSESTLLLSSSSGITPDKSGKKMKNPNRLVVGHPFNPPHQLPLVEICGTRDADETVIEQAIKFYRDLGKAPARLNKPVPGFVANRLQTVLALEAMKIVGDGVVDMASLDQIMLNSLGPRWASVGPLLAGHMGGGDAGLRGSTQHFLNSLARGMGIEPVDDETVDRLHEMAEETYPKSEMPDLIEMRDRRTIGILEARKEDQ